MLVGVAHVIGDFIVISLYLLVRFKARLVVAVIAIQVVKHASLPHSWVSWTYIRAALLRIEKRIKTVFAISTVMTQLLSRWMDSLDIGIVGRLFELSHR